MGGVEVVDRAGALWYARPDMNGRLPSGRKSWEFGTITVGRGAEVWGDWLSEDQAVDAIATEVAWEQDRQMEDDR